MGGFLVVGIKGEVVDALVHAYGVIGRSEGARIQRDPDVGEIGAHVWNEFELLLGRHEGKVFFRIGEGKTSLRS